MANISELTENPRKDMHMIYVLDTSGSMHARGKIDILNQCMKESIDMLRGIDTDNFDALIKISVLEFNTNCRWVTSNGPVLLEDFEWNDLNAYGLLDIGSALIELNSKLSRREFFDSTVDVYIPIIIVLTDGYASDDYQSALDQLRNNKWFTKAMKFGFAIDNADINMMSLIIGNDEAIVKTSDLDILRQAMKYVCIHGVYNKSLEGSEVIKRAIKDGVISTEDVLGFGMSQCISKNRENMDKNVYAWNDDTW